MLFLLLILMITPCLFQLHNQENYGKMDTHVASYALSVMKRSFTIGKPIGFTSVNIGISWNSCQKSSDVLLETVSDSQHWPIYIFNKEYPEETNSNTGLTRYGYILFVCSGSDNDTRHGDSREDEESDNYANNGDKISEDEVEEDEDEDEESEEDLLSRLSYIISEVIMKKGKKLIYYHTKILIILSGTGTEGASVIAKSIFKVLWDLAKITNVALIAGSYREYKLGEQDQYLESYTWFPYQGNCFEVHEIELLDKRILADSNNSTELNFFPSKFPSDFLGCTMKISALGVSPYIVIKNSTDENGNEVYHDSGLPSELLQSFARRYNITISYNKPMQSFNLFETLGYLEELSTNKTDFVVGNIPLFQITENFMDFTIPCIFEIMKLELPCPRTMSRIKRTTSIFTNNTWMMLGLIYLLSAIMLQLMSNIIKQRERSESHCFRNISMCLYCAWAVLLGISVPEMPRTHSVRWFFFSLCLLLFCCDNGVSSVFHNVPC